MALAMSRARPISQAEAPELYEIVGRLASESKDSYADGLSY